MAAQVLSNVAHLAALVSAEEAASLVRELDRTETLMPLLDPARYMREAESIAADAGLARAFLAFRRELDAAAARVRAAAARGRR